LGALMAIIFRISHAPKPALHARSIHGCPMVIGDAIEPVQSMVDGKFYTSKSALRATYKPSGNAKGESFVEVGNDPAMFRPKPKPKPDPQAVKAAVGRAFSLAGLGA
jgi:hypothetical protein